MYQFDPTNNLPAGVSHAAIERAMDGGWYMEEEVEEEGWFDVSIYLQTERGRRHTRKT